MKAKNVEFRKTHRDALKAEPSSYQRDNMMPHRAYEPAEPGRADFKVAGAVADADAGAGRRQLTVTPERR